MATMLAVSVGLERRLKNCMSVFFEGCRCSIRKVGLLCTLDANILVPVCSNMNAGRARCGTRHGFCLAMTKGARTAETSPC